MRQSFTLFSTRLTPRLWIEDWGVYAPALEAAVPDAPPLAQYTFRRGNLWQPTRPWQLPAPPEQAAPNAPPLTPYVFRRGGFWQTQKIWIDISPLDATPSIPNLPPLTQYVFRRGGLWQIQKFAFFSNPIASAAPPTQSSSGGMRRNDLQLARWQYEEDLLAALAAGVITKDEWTALMIL